MCLLLSVAQVGAAVEDADTEDRNLPFRQVPFCKYKGHTADLLDLSWSKVRAHGHQCSTERKLNENTIKELSVENGLKFSI